MMDSIGYFDQDGLWVSENKDEFRNWLSRHANKRAVLKVVKWYKKRSDKENRYYWGGIIEPLADYFGYSKEEMHDALKSMFLKIEIPGKPPKILSTAKLNTLEAETYYEQIRIWALSDYGIRLKLPNEFV